MPAAVSLPILLGHRNLWRNKRRTLITAASVALGVWVAVVFIGTRRATYERLIATGTRMGYGELTLAADGYVALPSPELHIPVAATAALIPPDLQLTVRPRIAVSGVVQTASRASGVALLGGDPRQESAADNLFLGGLVAGKAVAASDGNGCLIGTGLARQLAIGIADKLVYSIATASGEVVSHLGYVRGIFQTGSTELDAHMLVLPLASLQTLLGYTPDQASLLALYRSDASPPAAETAARLQAALGGTAPGGVRLHTWSETLPDLAQSIHIDQAMYRVVFGFIGLIVGSCIINTMMLNILERRRELGIMLAMGMPPRSIIAMMIWEAMSIGALGVVLGLITVTPIYLYLHLVGLDLSWLVGQKFDAGGIAIDFVLGCGLSPVDVAALGAGLFLMTMVAALYPALRAASTVPIKAIREP